MNCQLRYGEPDEVGMLAARVQHIPRLAAKWVERSEAASLTVLIARRGVVVVHEAFGRLGPESDAPLLPLDAVYPLASVTKPITATCVMCLVEDGVLGLTRPVQEYVPEFTGDGKETVMVHHLLTHTSGITPEAVESHATIKMQQGKFVPDEAACPGIGTLPLSIRGDPCLYDVPLVMRPGSEMAYCNINYTLLADIVGRVAGKPAAAFAEERVFKPLGMVDACLMGLRPGRLSRFVQRAGDNPFAALNYPEALCCFPGAGSATATAWDLAVFGQMLLNRGRYGVARILSAASIATMTRDQVPGIAAVYGSGERFPKAGWGYGFNIKLDKREANRSGLESPRTFEHGGAGGVSLLVDPAYELVIAYCSVETSGEVGGIHQWCLDHLTDAVIGAIAD